MGACGEAVATPETKTDVLAVVRRSGWSRERDLLGGNRITRRKWQRFPSQPDEGMRGGNHLRAIDYVLVRFEKPIIGYARKV